MLEIHTVQNIIIKFHSCLTFFPCCLILTIFPFLTLTLVTCSPSTSGLLASFSWYSLGIELIMLRADIKLFPFYAFGKSSKLVQFLEKFGTPSNSRGILGLGSQKIILCWFFLKNQIFLISSFCSFYDTHLPEKPKNHELQDIWWKIIGYFGKNYRLFGKNLSDIFKNYRTFWKNYRTFGENLSDNWW